MSVYRFTTRSITPGAYRLVGGVLAQLLAVSDIRKDVGRGDGNLGTCKVPTKAHVEYGIAVDVSDTGEYPLTATTQAADASTLTAKTLNADGTDTTIAFGASNGTAKSGAVYTAGELDQHDTDAAFLETNKAEIIPADTAIFDEFGVTGTYEGGGGVDTEIYMLKTTAIHRGNKIDQGIIVLGNDTGVPAELGDIYRGGFIKES